MESHPVDKNKHAIYHFTECTALTNPVIYEVTSEVLGYKTLILLFECLYDLYIV